MLCVEEILFATILNDIIGFSELFWKHIGGTTSECIFESDEYQIGVHSKNCYGPHGSAL